MSSRFNTIPEHVRQTDRRTDRIYCYINIACQLHCADAWHQPLKQQCIQKLRPRSSKLTTTLLLDSPVRQAWMKNIFGFPVRLSQCTSSKYWTISKIRIGLASLVYKTPSLPCVRKQHTNASKSVWSMADSLRSNRSRVSIVKSLWTSTRNFRFINSCCRISVNYQTNT